MKPMLAASTTPNLNDITYPVLASPKLDGIRCVIVNGRPMSRSLKPIPNLFVSDELAELNLPDLDGELMIDGDFNDVQSGIMSVTGRPNFYFNVFDIVRPKTGFKDRLDIAARAVSKANSPRVQLVEHQLIYRADMLDYYWSEWIKQGYEGGMVRSIDGPYKYGRSTLKQGYLIKLKTWHDDEGVVIGFTEQRHNDNPSFTGELGQTKRSSEQAGMVGAGTLGSLLLSWRGQTVAVGSGLDDGQRAVIWNNKDKHLGKKVTFKYQELTSYGNPRFPIFKGFRSHE